MVIGRKSTLSKKNEKKKSENELLSHLRKDK